MSDRRLGPGAKARLTAVGDSQASGAREKIRITGHDWDMSDWPPEEITVAGLVTPLEGCGDDDDRVVVVDAYGRQLPVIGVRRNGSHVEVVLDIEVQGQ